MWFLGLVCPEKTPAIDLQDKLRQVKKLCLEIVSGVGRLTAATKRLGLGVGEPFEAFPAKKLYLACVDFLLPQNVERLLLELCSCCHFYIHFGMPCSSFPILQNLNHGTRSLENPGGDGTLSTEVLGNKLADIVSMSCVTLFKVGAHFPTENPKSSYLWRYGPIARLSKIGLDVDFDQCRYGLMPPIAAQDPNNFSK